MLKTRELSTNLFFQPDTQVEAAMKKKMHTWGAFYSKNAIVTGIYGGGYESIRQQCKCKCRGRKNERKKGTESGEKEREKEKKRLGSGRGKWCEREEGRSHDATVRSIRVSLTVPVASVCRAARRLAYAYCFSLFSSPSLSFLSLLSLSLPLVVSYARSAARIRKYKTSRGSLFLRLRVVVSLRFFFCFVGHAREENPTKFRFFVYIS